MRRGTIVGLGIGFGLCIAAASAAAAGGAPPRPTPATTQKMPRRPPAGVVLYTDLAIDRIGVKIPGCRIEVTWTNKGTRKIDAVVTQRVEILAPPEPQQVVTTQHVVLEPGASFVHLADPSLVVHGAQQVLAWIDVSNVLGESQARRANNSATRTVTCGRAQPDLYPSKIDFQVLSTTQDTAGHTCKVLRGRPVILNLGTAPVSTPFTVRVETDNGLNRTWVGIYQKTVSALAVGGSLTLDPFETDTCLWFAKNPQMPANSPRRFRFTVDTGNQVHESLEDNNQEIFSY